jgi:hypothetical protein
MKVPEGLFMGKIPKPKVEPTYDQAVRLVTEVSLIRDAINKQLVKYWDWSTVKDLGPKERLDCLMALALQYSSKEIQYDNGNPHDPGPSVQVQGTEAELEIF